jgi:hypothetical protein
VFARLTFNPYFDWQSQVMMQVLSDPQALVKKTAPVSP